MSGNSSIHLRSWIIGGLAFACGMGLYVYDDWCEALQSSGARSLLNGVEVLVMGPGLGVLALLISEQVRLSERRYQEGLTHEREARFRFLGRIAASMAHEVRNPLHNIHLLTDELRHDLAPEAQELVDRINANIERLDQATLLIYELAKPQRKIDGDGYGPIDLVPLVTEVIEEIRARHGQPMDVVHAAPSEGSSVIGRTEGLRIVFNNLIRNAIEAADGGRVEIAYRREGQQLIMTIANPGSLPPEAASEDVDSAGHKPGGLGVGISIARHLLALFGGQVEFQSSDGVVTTTLHLLRATDAGSPLMPGAR